MRISVRLDTDLVVSDHLRERFIDPRYGPTYSEITGSVSIECQDSQVDLLHEEVIPFFENLFYAIADCLEHGEGEFLSLDGSIQWKMALVDSNIVCSGFRTHCTSDAESFLLSAVTGMKATLEQVLACGVPFHDKGYYEDMLTILRGLFESHRDDVRQIITEFVNWQNSLFYQGDSHNAPGSP